MKSNATLLTAVAVVGSVAAGFAADITGKVTLDGTPPPEKVIQPLMDDRFCGKLQEGKTVTTRHYLVGADKGLANVVVYIKAGAEAKKYEPTGEEPMIDQVGCLYEPYILGVMVNQNFKIRNSDPVMHNIHATPKNNPEFNFAQAVKGQVNEKSFANTELMARFKCDVHQWMFAYVSIFDNPYFTVTDKDGNYKISGVPAGKYTVEAVHQKAKFTSKEVEVTADGGKADFTLSVPTQ